MKIALLVIWAVVAIGVVRGLVRAAKLPSPNLELHFGWMVLAGTLVVPAMLVGEDVLGVVYGRLLVIILSLITLALYFTYNARKRRRLQDDQASGRSEPSVGA